MEQTTTLNDGTTLAPAAPVPSQVNWALAGQALAAVTGIFPEGPITPKDGAKAEGLVAAIQEAATDFCKFKPFKPFVIHDTKVDFEALYNGLMELTDAEVQTATEDLASPDLIIAWRFAVNQSRAYVKSQWPVFIRQTPTGPEWIEPSPSDRNRVTAIMHVVADPMQLSEEIARGSVTPSMIAAVKACHGALFDQMLAAYDAALKEAGQNKRKCPWAHELQMRMLFGVPPVGLISFGGDQETTPPKSKQIDIKFDDIRTKAQAVK